ncbi:LLM class flavin-dependent oxidoreductase [Oerskovia enterophila]|uniref:Mitomycin radical oxidase n=1 Tax=Oerskovia enterophila TaxID=43678 RepID=A0A163QXA6_9CELL|nr:LLM class flavin-dependent oxidoreductase [Oerskovia enterophila]KZM34633.1 mitomycin radical oxidase [Oerskovia enterophila]OCI32938.1 mitomycin radical oxidase [Oerskovia enterophila]
MTDYGHDLILGTFHTPQNRDPQAPVRLAQLAENAGLDLVTFQDHPYQPAFLDAWTLMTWVAASTERVQVAGNVLNLPLRPPAVLARAGASLDLLSGGRFAMGLGAGAFWDAIEAMGTPRLAPGEAVTALEEAIDIIRGIWDTSDRTPLRVHGTHHQVDGAKRGPAPAHDVPLWIGAVKPRMQRLIGRKGDGWLPSLSYLQPGDLAKGNAVIDEAALAAGRDPSAVRRMLNVNGKFSTSRLGYLQGPPEQWVEELGALALEDGVSGFVLATDDPREIQVFGEEVAPALRELVATARRSAGTAPAARRRGAAALAARREGIDYDSLPAALGERAVEPGDRAYDAVRHTYMRSGAPGVVLRPRSADEVAEAVVWAREQDVPLAVRSAGHGISGRSTNDGGVLLDVGALDQVVVPDDGSRRVRLGAGGTWGQVAEVLSPHGLAISSGDSGGVGVGGLATTGGIGLMGRKHGLTIDHVVAAEVVTADGRVRVVDARNEPELFWALRGAGGNMGVVTWVDVEATPVTDLVYSIMVLDASDTAGLLERWAATVEAAPRELTSFLHMSAGRGGRGPMAQLMTVWADDDTDAAIRALESLADSAPLLDHQAVLTPYSGIVRRADAQHSGGGEPGSRSGLLEHVDQATARDLARFLGSGAAQLLQLRAVGGAVNDVAADATAYAHRTQNFSVAAFGSRGGAAGIDGVWDDLVHPHTDGLYLSFETDARPERLLEAFPEPTLTRLRQVKRQVDPTNLFSANFPIPPADA